MKKSFSTSIFLGFGEMRQVSVVGGALPPVRAVRTSVLTDVDRPHPKYTVLNRLTNRQTGRQTHRQTHRHTDTQTHRHTDTQTDTQTEFYLVEFSFSDDVN